MPETKMPDTGLRAEALKTALQEIVLAIAFLGRDLSTYRMKSTGEDLIKRLSKADKLIRSALSHPNTGDGKSLAQAHWRDSK